MTATWDSGVIKNPHGISAETYRKIRAYILACMNKYCDFVDVYTWFKVIERVIYIHYS